MGKYLYGTKIQMLSCFDKYKFYTVYGQYRQLHLIREECNGKIKDIRCIDTEDLLEGKFEILEEQEEIDIQELKEFQEDIIEQATDDGNIKCLARKCNELIQAVKQLDNKLKEK